MKLLYRTAEWHALAKLRMHSDSTLLLLEELTTEFGQLIRQFRDFTCIQFKTVELPRETAARKRRCTKQQSESAKLSAVPCPSLTSAPASNPEVGTASSNITASAPPPAIPTIQPSIITSTNHSQEQPPGPSLRGSPGRRRGLNLFTVKLHFLGDYVRHIRLFGTTDSYSTQLVCENIQKLTTYAYCLQQGELAHRLVKQLYGLTNKKNAIQQIGKKYTRQQAFRNAEQQEEKEADQVGHLSDHHIISHSKNDRLNLLSFAQTNGDPAKKV